MERKSLRRKKGQNDEFLETASVVKELGSGSYNTAYLLESGDVLRVAFIKNEDSHLIKDAARGDTINYLISENRKKFGPSALKQKRGLFQVTKMPENLPVREIKSKKETCWMQVIEYLEYKASSLIPKDENEWWFIAFSLLWFFYTTQVEIGLIHQDFKLGNMAFRKLQKPATYQFKLDNDEEVFLFENITRVPVVFDFDFSITWGLTDLENMGRYGTDTWRSPELVGTNMKFLFDWGYDYFAVGNVLLYYACGYDAPDRTFSEQSEYVWKLSKDGQYDYGLEVLVMAGALNLIFDKNPIPKLEWKVFDQVDHEYFFGDNIRPLFLKEVNALASKIKFEKLSEEQKLLIRILIHWDPRKRTGWSHPYQVFDKFFKQKKKKVNPNADETFSYVRKQIGTESNLKERKANYGNLTSLKCSVCSNWAKNVCGCCEQAAYCGEDCADFDWYERGHHAVSQ